MEVKCLDCETKIRAYVRGRQGKLLERKYCKECYNKSHKNKVEKTKSEKESKPTEEAAPLIKLGGISTFCKKNNRKAICLDHHIFLPYSNHWKRSSSMPQPLIRLSVSVNEMDY